MLRESMEEQKKQALRQQQEHETMLSSLSHDIKTPLSAIKLYAKALERGLYEERGRQLEIMGNIGKKADEIEVYVGQFCTFAGDKAALSGKPIACGDGFYCCAIF